VTHDTRTCCAEHARAGAGLPAIEPGMPTPAGTGLSRRAFLLRSAGLALAVYGAGRLRRGRYRLVCTLEGHRELGMRAVLRVR
jgi:hypothetical protein